MDSSVHANLQGVDVDNEPIQVAAECLRAPLILRTIFQCFSNTELLHLSLVNKLWNLESRTLLRDRGTLTANIRPSHPCKVLRAFAKDLRQMNAVPFSGIIIDVDSWSDGGYGCVGGSAKKLGPSYDGILDGLRWKYLSVGFPQNWDAYKNCPASQLIMKIIGGYAGVLETLSLTVQSKRGQFVQQVLQDCRFSSLKTLHLHDQQDTTNGDYTSLIKALVSRAPNLRVLYTRGRVELMQNLLGGSSAVLVVTHKVCPLVEDICESNVGALRMRVMTLREIDQDMRWERIDRITPMLLQSSRTTLAVMDMDAVFLVLLMCYGICLENVWEFQMYFSCIQPYPPRILKIIKEFDFTHIFPRLTKVKSVAMSSCNTVLQEHIIEIMEQRNLALAEPMPDRAVNIKSLSLRFLPSLEISPAAFLPEMLPHVQSLCVAAFRGEFLPTLIWEQHWKELKELEVAKVGLNSSRNGNLDSVFCGIFPDEVAELREKSDEYLKAVDIVPVMPTIASLNGQEGLRTFIFKGDRSCFFHGVNSNPTLRLFGIPGNDPASMFSRVTGLVAFRRCPGLSVTLRTDDAEVFQVLNDMRPYACVELCSPLVRGPRN